MAFTPYVFPTIRNKFQPKVGDTYRFIGIPGSVKGNLSFQIGRRVWNNTSSDQARLDKNNVFKSIGRAKAVREALVATLQSYHNGTK